MLEFWFPTGKINQTGREMKCLDEQLLSFSILIDTFCVNQGWGDYWTYEYEYEYWNISTRVVLK